MRTASLTLGTLAALLVWCSVGLADESAWSRSRSTGDRAWRAGSTTGSLFRFVASDGSDAADGPSGKPAVKLRVPDRKPIRKPVLLTPSVPPRIRFVQPIPASRMNTSGTRRVPAQPSKPKVVNVRPNAAPQPTSPVRANRPPAFGARGNEEESIGDDTLEAMFDNSEPDRDSLFENDSSADDSDIDEITFPEKGNETPASDSSPPVTKPDAGSSSTTTPDPTPSPDPIPTPDPKKDPKPTPDPSSPKPDKPDSSSGDGEPLGNPEPDTPSADPPKDPKPPQRPVKLTIPEKKPSPKPTQPEKQSTDSPRPPNPGYDNPRRPPTRSEDYPQGPKGSDRPSPDHGGGKGQPPKNNPPPNAPSPKPPVDEPASDGNGFDPGDADGFPGIGGDDPRPLDDQLRDAKDALEAGDFPDNTPPEIKDRMGEQFPPKKSDRERGVDKLIGIGKGAVDEVVGDGMDKGLGKLRIPTLPTPIDAIKRVLEADPTNNGHPTDKAEIEMRDSWEEANKIKREMDTINGPGPNIAVPEAQERRLEELQKQLDAAEAKSKKAEEKYLETVKWRYEEMSKERPQQKDTTTKPSPSSDKSKTDNPHGPAGEGTKNKLLN